MRERVIGEVEKQERIAAGGDLRALDSEEEKDGPEGIQEERGEGQSSQRGLGGRALRGEPDGEMTEEHGPEGTAIPVLSEQGFSGRRDRSGRV